MPSLTRVRRPLRLLALTAFVATLVVVVPTGAVPAGAQDAPDGSRSTITQHVVHREPRSGGGWQITIEASLDSNAVCHVLLFQCVVEPELSPANMTLQAVECLSADWHRIAITLPISGTIVDVCARFDAERAGRDQLFRFVYNTDIDVGTVSETVQFFRFPEEFFFIRAQNTITINLAAEAGITESCPDAADIGSSVVCTVQVEALSNVPAASVSRVSPAQFANAELVPDADPGAWDCTALDSCVYTANGGTLAPGVYTFTATADVVGPPADVDDCSTVSTSATAISTDCATVRVYEADTDTFLDIEKTSPVTDATPGTAITYTITVTNLGPHAADGVTVFETPPAGLDAASIVFIGGDGIWTCTSAATLQCVAPLFTTDGVATFEVTAVLSAGVQPGDGVTNEIAASWANNPFGPGYTVRDGNVIQVVAAAAVIIPPAFTG